MGKKFKGMAEELKGIVESTGIQGEWQESAEKHTFRSREGGILNWWPGKGTIQYQGNQEARDHLQQAVDVAIDGSQPGSPPANAANNPNGPSQQIFIVHGHDTDARDQMELALHRLGLQPFILMNTSGGGKTIIEALEGKIGRDHTSDFGIVLMTPDDIGYAKRDGSERAEPRPRQNVILETGMLLASLTRNRMALIVKGHLELPSDLQGIIHFGYNDHVKEIVPKLCQQLREVGFDLDPNAITAATS